VNVNDCFDRFTAKVDWVESQATCWEWLGARTRGGYGQFRADCGSLVLAHRFAWETQNGPIPDGRHIDHLCRNRACVNPAHLEPVTPRTNTLRGVGLTAEFAKRAACANGHEFTEANTQRVASRPNARICKTCKNARDRDYRAGVRTLGCSRCSQYDDDGKPAECICATLWPDA